MHPVQIWTDLARASWQLGAMTLEAQAVIWMRLWGMAGVWNVTKGENARMVSEKLSAAMDAQQAVTRAMIAGKSPGSMAVAAIRPLRRRTKANLSRLTRRGPKLP